MSWQQQAACIGQTDLFFGTEPSHILAAKEVCRRCPVITECRQEWFKARRDTGHAFPGVWFGTSDHDRHYGPTPKNAGDATDRAIRAARLRLVAS